MEVGDWRPSPCHRIVFVEKKLCPTLSLSTHFYLLWVPAIYCWGVTLQWTSIPCSNTLSCFMIQKLAYVPDGRPPWLICDFNMQPVCNFFPFVQGQKYAFSSSVQAQLPLLPAYLQQVNQLCFAFVLCCFPLPDSCYSIPFHCI